MPPGIPAFLFRPVSIKMTYAYLIGHAACELGGIAPSWLNLRRPPARHNRTTRTSQRGGTRMARYYHVIKKQGKWHLYAGNAITSLMAESDQAVVTRAARALARHDGAKVVVHKDSARDVVSNGPDGRDDLKSLYELPLPLSAVETLRSI